MKLFELHTDLKSYKYPLIKIFVCLAIIAFSVTRGYYLPISVAWLDLVVTLICFALAFPGILCLIISVFELFQTYENRKENVPDLSKTKPLTIDTVVKMVRENAIIDIEACADGEIVKIGASADCKYASAVFTDKRFYLSDAEYETLGQFADALAKRFPDGTIPVSKIDDISIEDDIPIE